MELFDTAIYYTSNGLCPAIFILFNELKNIKKQVRCFYQFYTTDQKVADK